MRAERGRAVRRGAAAALALLGAGLVMRPAEAVLVKPSAPIRGWNSFDFGDGSERISVDAAAVADDSVDLDKISAMLREPRILLEIELGSGAHRETVWGCELNERYVEINAYYTT